MTCAVTCRLTASRADVAPAMAPHTTGTLMPESNWCFQRSVSLEESWWPRTKETGQAGLDSLHCFRVTDGVYFDERPAVRVSDTPRFIRSH